VANKVLFLQYVSLARSQPSSAGLARNIFKKAVALLEESKDREGKQFQDLQDLCHYYINFLEEEAVNPEDLAELTQLKNMLRETGCLASFNGVSCLTTSAVLGGVGKKRQNTTSVEQLES